MDGARHRGADLFCRFAVQSAMTSIPPILPTLAHFFEADVSQVSWAMTASFLAGGISGHA
jgi:hypothetical protein